jgi:hypothetical protein
MQTRRRLQTLVAAFLLSACAGGGGDDAPADPGGGNPPPPPPPPVAVPCTGTYSGAATLTFDCSVTALHGDTGQSSVSFDVTALHGYALDLIPAGLGWTGELTTGTRQQSDASVAGAYSMLAAGTAAAPVPYFATKGWPGLPDMGSSSLTITAVAAKPGTSPQEYDVDGTFTATLVAYPRCLHGERRDRHHVLKAERAGRPPHLEASDDP